jgi:glycosyltransferase involved in cell wall biosynthesis
MDPACFAKKFNSQIIALSKKHIERPLRVLHVLGGLNRGGVERWLIELARRLDRRTIQFDFVVHEPQSGVYESEIRDLGSQVLRCMPPSNPLVYSRRFLGLLRRHGPYDVVHSHVHCFSGLIMYIAKIAGVPGRVSHSHTIEASQRKQCSALRHVYVRGAQELIRRFASSGIACSNEAAADLFGADWNLDHRWDVFPCGIDLTSFYVHFDRSTIRRKLSIPDNAFLIGHVGRFAREKNHSFLLEVCQAVSIRRPEAMFLFVGDGPLRPEIEQKAADMGLGNIHFLGARDDIPALLAAMDVFVFPSHCEGLPLAAVEAQAAGLDCIVASHLPWELDAMPQLVHRLPLQAQLWAEALCEFRIESGQRSANRASAAQTLTASNFNIDRSLDRLLQHYERQLVQGEARRSPDAVSSGGDAFRVTIQP